MEPFLWERFEEYESGQMEQKTIVCTSVCLCNTCAGHSETSLWSTAESSLQVALLLTHDLLNKSVRLRDSVSDVSIVVAPERRILSVSGTALLTQLYMSSIIYSHVLVRSHRLKFGAGGLFLLTCPICVLANHDSGFNLIIWCCRIWVVHWSDISM